MTVEFSGVWLRERDPRSLASQATPLQAGEPHWMYWKAFLLIGWQWRSFWMILWWKCRMPAVPIMGNWQEKMLEKRTFWVLTLQSRRQVVENHLRQNIYRKVKEVFMLTINSLIFNGFGDLVWMMNIFIKEFKFSWHFLIATGSKYPLVDFCLSQGGRSRFLSNSGTIRDPAPAQSGRGTTQAVTYHQNTNLTLKAKQKIILEKRETSRRLHINKSIECWPRHLPPSKQSDHSCYENIFQASYW